MTNSVSKQIRVHEARINVLLEDCGKLAIMIKDDPYSNMYLNSSTVGSNLRVVQVPKELSGVFRTTCKRTLENKEQELAKLRDDLKIIKAVVEKFNE